jgi:hypothetical protein
MVSDWWVYPFMFILAIIAVVVVYATDKRMAKKG